MASIYFCFEKKYENNQLAKYLWETVGDISVPTKLVKCVQVNYDNNNFIEYIGFTTRYITSTGKEIGQFTEKGTDINIVRVVIDYSKLYNYVEEHINHIFNGKLHN